LRYYFFYLESWLALYPTRLRPSFACPFKKFSDSSRDVQKRDTHHIPHSLFFSVLFCSSHMKMTLGWNTPPLLVSLTFHSSSSSFFL
jgi:hypothetical protein